MKIVNYFMFFLAFLLFSCNDKNGNENNDIVSKGVLISNEGQFGNGDGSLSYFNSDSLTMTNDIFLLNNGRDLGDVVQSVAIANEFAFIIVNNSQKVEVINLDDFKSAATISGLKYPRYFKQVSDSKGYISNGNLTGKLYVIDLDNIRIVDSIDVGTGPEEIAVSGNYAYVANSGGWGYDSTISVIDISTNEVIKTVDVGDIPVNIEIDFNGDIWVLCKGKVVYDYETFAVIEETESKIVQVSASDYSILSDVTIGQTGDYYNPVKIAISKDLKTIYYTEIDGLYAIDCENTESINKICDKSFTGLIVDPDEDIIYGFTSPSYSTAGNMYRYKNNGELIDSFKVGIGPNGAAFFTLK